MIVMILYFFMAFIDYYRGRALARIGAQLQADMQERVFRLTLRQAEIPLLREKPAQGLTELAHVYNLFNSPVLTALLDLPWTPIYTLIMFLFHPYLGWFAVASMVLVIVLTLINQRVTRQQMSDAAQLGAQANN